MPNEQTHTPPRSGKQGTTDTGRSELRAEEQQKQQPVIQMVLGHVTKFWDRICCGSQDVTPQATSTAQDEREEKAPPHCSSRYSWQLALIMPAQHIRTLNREGDILPDVKRLVLSATYFLCIPECNSEVVLQQSGESYTTLPEIDDTQQKAEGLIILKIEMRTPLVSSKNGLELQFTLDDAASAVFVCSKRFSGSDFIIENLFIQNI